MPRRAREPPRAAGAGRARAGRGCRCPPPDRRTSRTSSASPSGSEVPAASRVRGVPTCASSTSGSVPARPFTTTFGLWFAWRASFVVQSMRAAKSCWNARPPAPDRGLVGRVGLAVGAGDGVARAVAPRVRVAALRPEGTRLAGGLSPHVAAAPAAVGGAHRARQPVVDEPQERRRVALVDAAGEGIELPERLLAPDVRVHPLVGEGREVRARRVAIEAIAADAGPGREVVLLAVLGRRRGDVVQGRELAADPGAGVVLVGDRVDAELRDERLDLLRACAWRARRAAPGRACWCRPSPGSRADARPPSARRGGSARPRATSCPLRPRPCRTRAARARPPRAGRPPSDSRARGASRFGWTFSYASRTEWMTSGRTVFFIQVEVVATSPSTSKPFE